MMGTSYDGADRAYQIVGLFEADLIAAFLCAHVPPLGKWQPLTVNPRRDHNGDEIDVTFSICWQGGDVWSVRDMAQPEIECRGPAHLIGLFIEQGTYAHMQDALARSGPRRYRPKIIGYTQSKRNHYDR